MNRRVLMRVAAAVGVLMVFSTVGHAAELKVFTSVALKQALNELSPIFEQKTGDKLSISYDLAAVQKKRILDGERADVIILTRAMMEDLDQAEQAGDRQHRECCPELPGRARGARAGAAKPDISTPTHSSRRCCQPNRSLTPIRPRAARAA